MHRGMPNATPQTRPIAYAVVGRGGARDETNFPRLRRAAASPVPPLHHPFVPPQSPATSRPLSPRCIGSRPRRSLREGVAAVEAAGLQGEELEELGGQFPTWRSLAKARDDRGKRTPLGTHHRSHPAALPRRSSAARRAPCMSHRPDPPACPQARGVQALPEGEERDGFLRDLSKHSRGLW
jgi:hypothetical protein